MKREDFSEVYLKFTEEGLNFNEVGMNSHESLYRFLPYYMRM